MKGFNLKIMEEFIKVDLFLMQIMKENPETNLKTIYNTFVYGDSVMKKKYDDLSKTMVNPG